MIGCIAVQKHCYKMELLLAVVLAGLISCARATGPFDNVDKAKCYAPFPSTYVYVKFDDDTILDNKNQGAVLKRSTIEKEPTSVVFPYQPGQYYNFMLVCNYSDTSSKTDRVYWHVRNIQDLKLDDAETHIPYKPVEKTANPDCCVFLSGKQNCRKGSAANTNHDPENRYVTELASEDCVEMTAAGYFQCEKYPPPPPPKPPSNPPCKSKPLLPINLSLSGCGCGS